MMIKQILASIGALFMHLTGADTMPSRLAVDSLHVDAVAASVAPPVAQSLTIAGPANRKVVSPAPRQAWNEVLQADPDALVSQSPAWTDVMCAAGNYADASRYYELADGQRMILPMARDAGLLLRLESPPPAWGFGGLLSTMPLRPSDVATVFDDLSHLNAVQITIRPNPLDADVWRAGAPDSAITVPRRAHIIDLAGGLSAVTKHFDKDARYNIRKAERNGVTVEHDTSARLVPVFYDLFKTSLERWAGKQHEPVWMARWRGQRRDSMDKFLQMSRDMNGACHWYVAWVGGQPAGAILALTDKNTHYTRSVMNHELASSASNYLLLRTAIEDACQAGCRWFHMGETGASESLAYYKEHFGAQAYPYAEYRIERLPISRADKAARNVVKKIIGFKDV